MLTVEMSVSIATLRLYTRELRTSTKVPVSVRIITAWLNRPSSTIGVAPTLRFCTSVAVARYIPSLAHCGDASVVALTVKMYFARI